MNEQELRQLYAMSIIEVVGAAPDSAFERPLSPIMLKFAENLIRRVAQVADECDSYQEYDMNGMILEEFGLTR